MEHDESTPDVGHDEATPVADLASASPAPAKTRQRVVIEWVLIIIGATLASLLLRTYVVQTFYVPSGSMEPTLWPGDRIIVNKLSAEFGTIHIGDIVVFKAPPGVKTTCSDAPSDLVKRVIGLPGDHLSSIGNTIYVNGHALDQKWSVYPALGTPLKNTTVPAGQYFMMGDNHADSCDSRFWGTVPKSSIVGKVFLRVWPLSAIHWF